MRYRMFNSAVRNVVLTWIATADGGAERSTCELATALSKHLGVQVSVIWWSQGNVVPDAGPATSVKWNIGSGKAWYREALGRSLSDLGLGTIIISNHRSALVDMAVADKYSVPVIPVCRAIFHPGQKLRFLSHESDADLIWLSPEELPWNRMADAAMWVGTSKATLDSISASSGPVSVRSTFIYNGVSLQDADPVSEPNDTRRFIVVSRLAKWKNVEHIIRAFGLMQHDRRGAVLQIFGDGPERDSLMKLSATCILQPDIVKFQGFRTRWHDELRASDILISASDSESFGRAVVEAAWCGVPALVPDKGGSSEVVLPGITGLHYPTGNIPELASFMHGTLECDSSEVARLGHNAARRARAIFGIDRCAAEYLSLASDLINAGQAVTTSDSAKDG